MPLIIAFAVDVSKIVRFLDANPRVEIFKNTNILDIRRQDRSIFVKDSNNNENKFDHIIFSTNPTKTLKILNDIDDKEKNILSNFSTNKNLAYLHNDKSLKTKAEKERRIRYWFILTSGCAPKGPLVALQMLFYLKYSIG